MVLDEAVDDDDDDEEEEEEEGEDDGNYGAVGCVAQR